MSPLVSAGDRVRHILELHWKGNQTEMARAIGCSQASLSKVLNRKIEPGKRLLSLMAKHPNLNPEWVFSGKGKPLKAEERANTGLQIPIAKQVLPGPPDAFPEFLTEFTFAWASSAKTGARYWLQVQHSDPITRSPLVKIAKGDLLLMETDRAFFPPVDALVEHLCAVRLGASTKLALVSHRTASPEDGGEHLRAETFDYIVHPSEIVEERIVQTFSDGTSRSHLQRSHRKNSRTPVTEHQFEPIAKTIVDNDIVAICSFVVRAV